MLELDEIIPIIAILTLFLGAPSVVFYWILRMKREARDVEASGAVGMNELEERIQKAVRSANEPLRLQIEALEDRLDALASPQLRGVSSEAPQLPPHELEAPSALTSEHPSRALRDS